MPASDFPPTGDLERPPRPWRPSPLLAATAAWHGLVVGAVAARPERWRAGLAALAANHLALSLVGCMPRQRWLGPNVSRLPADAREGAEGGIAGDSGDSGDSGDEVDTVLTFDDGPDPDVTPAVADLLEARGLRATFFCIGERMERHPGLVRRLSDAGHRIENHTFRHASTFAFSLLPGLDREIGATQEVATRLTGRAPAWFRAPAGIANPLLDAALAARGLHFVSWTRRAFDTVDGDPRRVLSRLLGDGARRGEILLLHDGNAARTPSGRPVVLEVLPRLLDHLEARGLRPGPLPEPWPGAGG